MTAKLTPTASELTIGVTPTSPYTQSSTRKFVSADVVKNPPQHLIASPNADVIVDTATQLKNLAVSTDQIAAQVRDAIATVRGNLAASLPALSAGSKALTDAKPPAAAGNARSANSIAPLLERVTLDANPSLGVSDSFVARIVFSVPHQSIVDRTLRAIKIFRAEVTDQAFSDGLPRLSLFGMDNLRSPTIRTSTKNQNYLDQYGRQLAESKIDNAVTALLPTNLAGNSRVSTVQRAAFLSVSPTSSGELSSVKVNSPEVVAADLKSFVDPTAFAKLDSSVARNVLTLQNATRQFQSVGVTFVGSPPQAGAMIVSPDVLGSIRPQQGRLAAEAFQSGTQQPSTQTPDFKQIAFFAPDALTNIIIGDQSEYSFVDPTVQFGHIYKYYVVTVDNNAADSQRSAITELRVSGLRVPKSPKRLVAQAFRLGRTSTLGQAVSLSIIPNDDFAEKFEIYRRDESAPFLVGDVSFQSVSTTAGYATGQATLPVLDNGFAQIGEALAYDGGAVFIDINIQNGHAYAYRVYSVDIFGNKSESPIEQEVFIPEPSHRLTDIDPPNLTVEIDASTQKIRVTIAVDDKRISGMFLERIDYSIEQTNFSVPGSPGINQLPGTPRSRIGIASTGGPTIMSPEDQWTGFIIPSEEPTVFIDRTVVYDHIYQYKIKAIDKFGNDSSPAFSRPIFVPRRPLIRPPVDPEVVLDITSSGDVNGVRLSWGDGNIGFTAEDTLGSQGRLQDSSVRMLFQVQRRRIGEGEWRSFPMMAATEFVDEISTGSTPDFRPDFLRLHEAYEYRVAAFQTGAFISNFTAPVQILVQAPLLPPAGIRAIASDTRVAPFFVMLNWNDAGQSSSPDHWEIQRVAINNYAADRLNFRDANAVTQLNFQPFRNVFLESSRFRERQDDQGLSDTARHQTIVGTHHYMDSEIQLGNTYVYRMRAVSVADLQTEWVYRAVRMTDQAFETRASALISPAEIGNLALSSAALNPSPVLTGRIATASPGKLGLAPLTIATPTPIKPVIATFSASLPTAPIPATFVPQPIVTATFVAPVASAPVQATFVPQATITPKVTTTTATTLSLANTSPKAITSTGSITTSNVLLGGMTIFHA